MSDDMVRYVISYDTDGDSDYSLFTDFGTACEAARGWSVTMSGFCVPVFVWQHDIPPEVYADDPDDPDDPDKWFSWWEHPGERLVGVYIRGAAFRLCADFARASVVGS